MSPVRTAADGYRARAGGPWTRAKLEYLQKYSAAFMTAMAPKRKEGKWDKLVYIDPLCGPGKDIDDSGDEFAGSPLIALQTRPTFDHIFLGDKKRVNVSALRRRIPPADVSRVSLKCDDCHQRVLDVVRQLSGKTLGLAFVDPEGFEVRFDLFKTLASRRVDIVFLFPSGIGIKRNLRAFVRTQHCPLDDMWGSRAWRETPLARLLAGSTSASEAFDDERLDRSWAQAFCDRVASLGYREHDILPPLRNEQNVPMYHLLFFSKDQAGLTIWRGIGRIEPGGQRRLGLEPC